MLLILKAREAMPKRGYFYRSWTTIVNCIAMAKDLDLHEHYELHKNGNLCGSSSYDCVTKSRVWHMLFVLELMIGGPQGKTDFTIGVDTVDFGIPRPSPGTDDAELSAACNWSHFMRVIRNVRISIKLYAKLRKTKKDWAHDPEFQQHNASYDPWLRELPPELQISYPPDDSPPQLSHHFVGNLHSYHYLAIIMHLRPQMQASLDASDMSWRQHFVTSYEAAKKLCRLQESLLQTYGLAGMMCMQRGVNFAIYSILTCIMLHLVRTSAVCSALKLNQTGRPDIARSGSLHGRHGLFHSSYADTRRVHAIVSHARAASADRCAT